MGHPTASPLIAVNPKLIKQHQAHLDGYWPILTFATGVEAMCFFLIHPDLFTLVVCIKTMLMLAIWLARRSDGSFVRVPRESRVANARSLLGGEPAKLSRRHSPPQTSRETRPKTTLRRGVEIATKTTTRTKTGTQTGTGPGRNVRRRLQKRLPGQPSQRRHRLLGPVVTEMETVVLTLRILRRNDVRGTDAVYETTWTNMRRRDLGRPSLTQVRVRESSVLMPDLAEDLAERAARRKRRGAPGDGESAACDNVSLTPDPGQSDDPEAYERRDYEYDSDNAPRDGDPGASFFERFKRFDRSNGGSIGPRQREPSSPPDLYTTRQGGRVAAPGVTQQQHGHTVGRGGYKGIYLDESNSDFQCPIKVPDRADPSKMRPATRAEKRADSVTAPWERALEHDSIDLLQFYLFAEGVHDHIRGWIIMDLLEERDEVAARELAMGWKEVYQLPLTSTTRKNKIRKLLEPYRHFEHRQDVWRPAAGDWWSRARFGAHGAKVNVEYGLDDLLWSMRASGVSPAARHAMVRDLLSQPSEDAYLDRKKRLLEAVEMKDRWDDPVKYKAVKDELVYHYQKKDRFGGRDVISQKRLAEIAEEMQAAKVPRATIGKILREIRWNLPKGGWRGVLKRIQDAGGL